MTGVGVPNVATVAVVAVFLMSPGFSSGVDPAPTAYTCLPEASAPIPSRPGTGHSEAPTLGGWLNWQFGLLGATLVGRLVYCLGRGLIASGGFLL